jgi:hypothetical protein
MIDMVIGSDVDRDTLYAELRYQGRPWAEVVYDREREAYVVTFYAGPAGTKVPIDVSEARQALLDARNALVSRGCPDVPVV